MRTFLTLVPDMQTALAINKWSELCWPMLAKHVPVQNYHVTISFLGELDDIALQSLADLFENFEHPAFSISLNKLGYWPDTNVLWLGTVSIAPELVALHEKCKVAANKIGVRGGGRKFEPHLTLARNLDVPPTSALIEPDFEFKAESLELWSSVRASSGARYSTVAQWQLY